MKIAYILPGGDEMMNRKIGRPAKNPTAPLRQRADRAGYGTEALSLAVRCHHRHLDKILNGEVQPRRDLAIRLAKALGCSPADVLWPEPVDNPIEKPVETACKPISH